MTIPDRLLGPLSTTASVGASSAIVGAVSHQDLLTWSGVIVAVVSALVSGAVAGYHKIREAARQEDVADREATETAIRRQISAQMELEQRSKANAAHLDVAEHMLAELLERVKAQAAAVKP